MSSFQQKQKLIQNTSILLTEIISIFIAYTLSLYLRHRILFFYNKTDLTPEYYVAVFLFIVLADILLYIIMDWNSKIFKRGYFIEFVSVVKYNLALLVSVTFILFVTQNAQAFSRLVFVYFFVSNTILTYIGHLLTKKYLDTIYRKSSSSSKCLIITTSDLIEGVLKQLKTGEIWAHELSSIILMDGDYIGKEYDGIPVVANSENIFEVASSLLMDEVFINLPEYSNRQLERLINRFEYAGVPVHVNVDFFDIITAYKTIEDFAGFTVLSYATNIHDYRRMIIKRCIDILGALVGLIITALFTPFVALAIFIESPGPIFFKQVRIGKNGREFNIYKFRSMYPDAEARKAALMENNEMDGLMFKMTDDPRITKVGKFIRKTSIDELPQFWNILIGDMSLVGTRPPTKDEFEQYNLYYRRRLSIKPGLTGMWQVSGRSDINDFEEVVQLDLRYIDDWSLTLDIKILFQTVFVVLFRRGSK